MITVRQTTIDGLPLLEVAPTASLEKQLPTVVFFHGWTNHKESVLVNGYELGKRGFRALLPEAYLHGERSTGKSITESSLEFWNVVHHNLYELPIIRNHYIQKGLSDPDRFGVTGLSMGGITTSAALTQYAWIKAAVVLMGNPSPVSFTEWLLSSKTPENTEINMTRSKYMKEIDMLKKLSLSRQPEKINGRPLHFWHGTEDNIVPYQPTFDFYQEIKNQAYAEQASFTTAKGVGHKVPYLASVEMADFFAKHL